MAYASGSDVASFCRNLRGSAGSIFTTTTDPTLASVDVWLSSGCGVMETKLKSYGYTTPVASTATAYGWMRNMNALYAAARAELSMATNMRVGERTRGQVFDKMFWDELNTMLKMDLTLAGIARSSTGVLYTGGISETEKDTYESDSDRVDPRFHRGVGAFPGTIRPDGTSGS